MKAKSKANGKTNGKKAATTARKPRNTESVALRVRKLVVAKPNVEFEAIAAKLGGKHKEGGHAWNIYNHARQVMKLAGEARAR